ncbi:Retrovirus-related Pol polyprotein, partial [Mucuna pruriens]
MSILSELLQSCMEVFMNDFTVFGLSFDACLESLSRVLDRCIETNLLLNFEKCHFMLTKGIVIGHLVSNRGIEVDKTKIDIIASLSHLVSMREVRSFLGWTCTFSQEAPDWELPFELMYDASNMEHEAVLGQRVGNHSHANYTSTEKELLAIVFALDKFCSYLFGSKIIVFSDHAALKFLLKKPNVCPPSYTRNLRNKLQRLHQGSRSVEEYHKEMEMDLMRA